MNMVLENQEPDDISLLANHNELINPAASIAPSEEIVILAALPTIVLILLFAYARCPIVIFPLQG
jgi:hypothetical protein